MLSFASPRKLDRKGCLVMTLVPIELPVKVANALKYSLLLAHLRAIQLKLPSFPLLLPGKNTLPTPLTSRPRLRGVALDRQPARIDIRCRLRNMGSFRTA